MIELVNSLQKLAYQCKVANATTNRVVKLILNVTELPHENFIRKSEDKY